MSRSYWVRHQTNTSLSWNFKERNVSKREKVLEVMAKHPSWGVLLVAKKAKCSPSYAHLLRKQVKEAEYNAAKAELEAESTPEERFWESVVDSTATAMSVLGMELEAESTATATSVSVPATGISAEVETSYKNNKDLPPTPVATRSHILDTAKSYITRDRQADHGDAEDNFSRIAGYWSLHTGVTLTATDVAVMMALLKVARIKQNPQHVDNWVDGAGYFACGGEIANQ
jgi:hypothetical protein